MTEEPKKHPDQMLKEVQTSTIDEKQLKKADKREKDLEKLAQEDLRKLLKTDFGLGRELLYLIVDQIENDKHLRREFSLP